MAMHSRRTRTCLVCGAVAGLVLLSRVLAAEPQPAPRPAAADTLPEAWAACGGPPIQDGHDVQPTPAHDRCLAKKQDIPLNDRVAPPPSPAPAARPPKPQP
jgi:hypothetical protein